MKYKLNDTQAKNAKTKPDGKQVKYADGGGLYLLVMKSGKYWRYDFTYKNKRKTLAIGVYPDISLKSAREKHQHARTLLASGINPSENKQAVIAEQIAQSENSFEAVAREWHLRNSIKWSDGHRKQILKRIEVDLFPYIGNNPITDIEPRQILKCLRRIEERGAISTAHRVMTDAAQIFRYAIATDKATRDPTSDLKGALTPENKQNFPAITDPKKIGELLRDILDYNGTPETITALQLLAYLFQRPAEIRCMEWSEINFETAQWAIPAEKMKRKKEHLVPLPFQVIALLKKMKPLTGHLKYVFPAKTNVTKPINKNTLPAAIHRMGYDKHTMTAHGFRALASTRLYEMGYMSDLIEKQLSHRVGNEVRHAYDRSQHIEQRTDMMQQWANYLDALKDGADILPFRANGGDG